ncbi:MAG: NAAT family transporter [Bdellovibrionota bacterium]|nr:NAAT family transporter [Bdellovibrionota bacterium]
MTYFDDSLKLLVSLLSILNPIGVIPVFISLTESFSEDKVKSITTSCALSVMATLFISFALGQNILNFFGISLASFSIAGGILLSGMALQMIAAQNVTSKLNEDEQESLNPGEIGVVPLAIPLLAGPGTMSQAIIYSNKVTSTYHWIGTFLVVLIIGLLIKLILQYSKRIGRRLGIVGLNVMTRIMGLIILSLSIEIIASGMRDILPALGKV